MNNFQERLQDLLIENELSRLQLAKRIGISFETLNGYFNKDFYPELSVAIKIANYFGCSLQYLMGLTDEYQNTDRNNLSFVDTVRKLINENNLSIERLMKALDMSEANFYRWKNNNNKPAMQSLIALAQFFDVSALITWLAGKSKYLLTLSLPTDKIMTQFCVHSRLKYISLCTPHLRP